MNPLFTELTITRIEEEVKGVKLIYFEDVTAGAIPYKAGQYLTLVQYYQDEEVRRSYSIISSPALKEPLPIGVKRVENGFFSRLLVDRAKVGDKVITAGAAGFFILPDNLTSFRQIFFLAAGSGVTPIFSLLKTVLHAHPHLSVVLIYSNSSVEETMLQEELARLELKFPDRFKVEYLYSNSARLNRARLHKDLLEEFLDQFASFPYPEILFFICGPLNYMRMANYALHEVGVPAENIRRENFNTENVPVKAEPPDQDGHHAFIQFRGTQYKVYVQYPDNILKAARKNGIVLPYSCEAGKCGNCVATCKSGKVWMANNEVLTDKEVAKGLVLTCVGFPVEGDVYLEI